MMCLILHLALAQRAIEDIAIRYQLERMVFKQWAATNSSPDPAGWVSIPLLAHLGHASELC
jgi:hypothetical protein